MFLLRKSDVMLKHSDVLPLRCKVMLSLLITLPKAKHHCETTSLRSNITCRKANLVIVRITFKNLLKVIRHYMPGQLQNQ